MTPIKIKYRDVQRGTPFFRGLLSEGATMEVHGKEGFMFFISPSLDYGIDSEAIANTVVSKLKDNFQ